MSVSEKSYNFLVPRPRTLSPLSLSTIALQSWGQAAARHLFKRWILTISVRSSCWGRYASKGVRDMKTETLEYKDGDLNLRGYYAYDDQKAGKRPGILVMPEA